VRQVIVVVAVGGQFGSLFRWSCHLSEVACIWCMNYAFWLFLIIFCDRTIIFTPKMECQKWETFAGVQWAVKLKHGYNLW